jgi:hypothetical protein
MSWTLYIVLFFIDSKSCFHLLAGRHMPRLLLIVAVADSLHLRAKLLPLRMCNDQCDYDGDNDKRDTNVYHVFQVFDPPIIRQSVHLDGFDKFFRVLVAFKPVFDDLAPLVVIGVPQVIDTCVGLREIRGERCKLLIDLRELRTDLRESGYRCCYRGHRRGEHHGQHHHNQHRKVHHV